MSATSRLHRRTLRRASSVALASALALTACGGTDATDDGATDGTPTATDDVDAAESTPDLSGEPPTELVVEQLSPPSDPDAPEAKAGDVVAVHYVGRSFSTGDVFDSSEGRDPITFELGAGGVIPGWEQGIAGLQVGERARLTIPPDLAYGEAGAGGGLIAPNETLVFDVQLVDILDQTGATEAPTTEG